MSVYTRKSDRPGYPDFSGRAPWALVTGAGPLNSQPPVRIAGPAEASVSSATSGRDKITIGYTAQKIKRYFDRPGYPAGAERKAVLKEKHFRPLVVMPQIRAVEHMRSGNGLAFKVFRRILSP